MEGWGGAFAALATVLWMGCAHGGPSAAEDDSPEALRARFHQAVRTFRENQRPGGAPDAPGLARLASAMLRAHAVRHTFSGNPGDLTLVLEPALDTGLNRLALQVRDTVKGQAVYDVGRLLKSPDATAAFDPVTNVLSLPHAAIADLNADEPTVRHELVHVRTFGTLRTGWLSPYQGYVQARALGAEPVFLDELNAYGEDLRFAASQLAELLRRDPDPAGRLAGSHLSEVLRARVAGEKPKLQLTFLESVWDRLLARTIYGGSLALPAAEALLRLERAAQTPGHVTYVQDREGPMAVVRAATGAGETLEELTGRFHLPSSLGLDDPRNAEILARQLTSAQQAAQERADQFGRAMGMLRRVADEISPAERARLLSDATAMAGD